MVKSTMHIDAEEPIVACWRDIYDWGKIKQSGVIDQNIDLAGFVDDRIDAGLNRTDIAHIHGHRGASWSNFRSGPFRSAKVDTPDDNSAAFLDVRLRECLPNATRPARDERNFILQSHCQILPIYRKRGFQFASGRGCPACRAARVCGRDRVQGEANYLM
jgi:hypothetical protein